MRHGPGPHMCGPAGRRMRRPEQQEANRYATVAAPGRGQAACGRYASHAAGMVGLATWIKISACGVRGVRRGCMPA